MPYLSREGKVVNIKSRLIIKPIIFRLRVLKPIYQYYNRRTVL
jgi:hypothetical protein